MKVAIVHELLTMKGGAERVLKVLGDAFPEAPIYTLLYDEKRLGDWFPAARVRTSRLQKFAAVLSYNHHLYLPFFPGAVEAWNFDEFDLVISSSSAFAHGIRTNGKTKHLSYIHSPARYLWDRTHDVQSQTNWLGHLYLSGVFHRLREWDATAALRATTLLAASHTVQRRIELYWRRKSTVVHPPLDGAWLTGLPARTPQPYFLVVSTLARYKRIELAIEACNRLRLPLKIAGTGADEKRLRALAGPTVEFLGYQTEADLKTLYANARATIFPGDEDFGLVPLESLACGTPVIAYGAGGALETLSAGKTGEFFAEPTVDSLCSVLDKFDQQKYSTATLQTHARQFDTTKFLQKFHAAVAALIK